MSKEESAKLASEIAGNIVEQQKGPIYQVVEASYTAYASDIASYDATLAATKAVTSNTDLVNVSTFTSSVTSSAISAVNVVTTPNVSNKTLLLLQPFVNDSEKIIIKTFNYYWDKYPELFEKIQIVYTDIDENGKPTNNTNIIIQNNIKYLNEYYNRGYNLFVGFNTSTILAGVLPWFENVGIEAKGISLNSSSISLDIPKPIYRLQICDNKLLDSLNFILTDASKIYYVFSGDELATKFSLEYLEIVYPGKIIPYPVTPNSSNLTLSDIQNLYKDVDSTSVSLMCLYVNSQLTDFLNVFNDSYPMPTSTYDTATNPLVIINETSKKALLNKYNRLVNISFSTSEFFRDGLNELKTDFSTYVPNALLLINNICLQQNINSLPSHNSILEFNENNDIKYFTFLNTIYSEDDKDEYYYKEDFYSVYDPIVGKKLFYVNNKI
jgi:hypothetical protein